MRCAYKNKKAAACQFDDGEFTTEYDGHSYCRWHLPRAAKAEWCDSQKREFAIALAAWMDTLTQRAAEENFVGVVFVSPVYWKRAFIKANFNSATFMEEARFSSATF
jgi:hypothetical protein